MQYLKRATCGSLRCLNDISPLLLTIFALSVVGMNLLANKSIETGIPWLVADCGILFSGVAFLAMDVIVHCYGPRAAVTTSLVALGLNLAMSLFFFSASLMPGAWGESFAVADGSAINQALNSTFGGTWFIILGSSIAFMVSAIVNSLLNWAIGERVGERGFGVFALRSYVSTFVAQFADNLTFAFLVSRVFFGWGAVQCVSCAAVGAVLELLFEVFFSPVGYRISQLILHERVQDRSGLETGLVR